jgi:hypothetical protein
MPKNIDPKVKTSCHAKFFKKNDEIVVKMSFQEFLKANKLNKEWKANLLDTHYKLGEMDEENLRKTVSNLVSHIDVNLW